MTNLCAAYKELTKNEILRSHKLALLLSIFKTLVCIKTAQIELTKNYFVYLFIFSIIIPYDFVLRH